MNNKLSKLLLRGTIHEATLLKSETPSITMANHFFNEVSNLQNAAPSDFENDFNCYKKLQSKSLKSLAL